MNDWLSGLLVVGWGGLIVFFRVYRIWLFYYVLGTIGCAYGLTLIAHHWLGLDKLLGESVAWSIHTFTGRLHVPTRIFEGTPDAIMVMVVSQDAGWTLFRIGIESSGLLEMIVLTSLLLFYPGLPLIRRTSLILLGLGATWLANVLRVLVIVLILHHVGKEALLLAHSFVGRTLFFILTVGIYWFLLTIPTLRWLSR